MTSDSNGLQSTPSKVLLPSLSTTNSHLPMDSLSDDDVPLADLLEFPPPQCDTCGLTFPNMKNLQKHMKVFNYGHHKYFNCCKLVGDGDHDCKNKKQSGCKEKSKTDRKMKNRRRKRLVSKSVDESNADDKPFECSQCSSTFRSEIGLRAHLRFGHKTKIHKCGICEETFVDSEALSEHVLLHDSNDKVVCKNCRAEFSTLKQYRVHSRLYPLPHNFRCTSCLRQFPLESRLKEHVCVIMNGQPFLCACGEQLKSYPAVVEHAKGNKPFRCCSCSYTSTSLTAFIRHIRKHSQQKPYECKLCDLDLSSLELLKSHIQNLHGEVDLAEPPGESTCNTCGGNFSSVVELSKHLVEHDVRVPCPDCGKLFRSSRLKGHQAKHSRSPCLCPDCGKLFDSYFRFSQHMHTAHNSQPVKCDICNKVLKTKKILTEHLKTHLKTEVGTRVAQAICPMCGLQLAQKGSLARHILLVHERHRMVKDNQPRICKECGVILPNKAKYYTHRRQHRAMVERFTCPLCKREFNKKHNLARHKFLLHEKGAAKEPTFRCDVCSRSFRERKNLSRHYLHVHKIK